METKKELLKIAEELKTSKAILKSDVPTIELLKKAAYIRLKTFHKHINK